MQPPRPPLPRTPICLGLILAQAVSFDQQTGILSIIGPYQRIEEESFPATYRSLEIFAILTECDGDVMVEVRLVDLVEARPPVFRQLQTAHFNGPDEVQELIFHQFNVTIPVKDHYRLQLYVHGPGMSITGVGVPVLERRLAVVQA